MFHARTTESAWKEVIAWVPRSWFASTLLVADEAFPLRPDMMKPYPTGLRGNKLPEDQLVFNYRLSRACRIS